VAYLKEQRICYKFCLNVKKIASETYRTLLKAFYDDTMSRVQMLNGIHVSDKCVIRNGKSVVIMWRKCQLKREILLERADIVTWRSRYLKEVQEYWENEHLMFSMQKTWTDSKLAFHKCWQEGAVMGIHTHVNSGQGL